MRDAASLCSLLVELWVALIQDWMVLASQRPEVLLAYRPRLFSAPTPLALSTVKRFLDKSWCAALAAACALLAAGPAVSNNLPP